MSDTPASSSYADKAMKAAEELDRRLYTGELYGVDDLYAVIRKHLPPSVPVKSIQALISKWEKLGEEHPTIKLVLQGFADELKAILPKDTPAPEPKI